MIEPTYDDLIQYVDQFVKANFDIRVFRTPRQYFEGAYSGNNLPQQSYEKMTGGHIWHRTFVTLVSGSQPLQMNRNSFLQENGEYEKATCMYYLGDWPVQKKFNRSHVIKEDFIMEEIRKIKEVVGERSHPTECDVFTGVMLRDDLDDEIHVTIVAADFEQFEPTTIDMALNESTKQLDRPDMSSIPTLTDLRKSLSEALPIPNIDPIEGIKSQDPSTSDIKTPAPPLSADTPSDWTDEKSDSASPRPLDQNRQSAPYFNEEIPDR